MKKEHIVLLLSLLLLTNIFLSGCVNPDEERIIGINLEIQLNTNEVNNINYVDSSEILFKKNITLYNRGNISEPGDFTRYSAVNNTKTWRYLVIMTKDNESWIKLYDDKGIKEPELENKKNDITKFVQKVASACNLTIDWSQAEWTVNYAD